ncbi:hypothetical protein [Microbacterium sp.]
MSADATEDEIAEWLAWHEGTRAEALMYLKGGICDCCGVSYREGVSDA